MNVEGDERITSALATHLPREVADMVLCVGRSACLKRQLMLTRSDRRRILGVLVHRLPELKLSQVADPRRRRGRRHALGDLLRMAMIGLTAGARTLREVEGLCADLGRPVREKLGVQRLVPDTTLRDLLVAMDPTELRGVMRRSVRAAVRRKSIRRDRGYPCGVVSIDGKTTRTVLVEGPYAQRVEGRSLYGLVRTLSCTLVSSNAFPCIDVVPIPAETNETGCFAQAFESLCAEHDALFEVFMGDAAFGTAAHADLVDGRNKGYVFQLKDNSPVLLADIKARLSPTQPAVETYVGKPEKTRGKRLVRRLRIAPVNAESDPDRRFAWKSARHVMAIARIEVDRATGEETVIGERFFATNLRRGRFTNEQWLAVLRDRWEVENQTHATLDVAFEEDDYPWIEQSTGMVNVMILRRIAMNLLACFRACTLTQSAKRATPWARLFIVLRDALVTATADLLDSFRPRPGPATQ